MKRTIAFATLAAFAFSLTACGGGSAPAKASNTDVDALVSDYGFQWTDPDAPILNDAGAQAISFNVYSSKNASALDYWHIDKVLDFFYINFATCYKIGDYLGSIFCGCLFLYLFREQIHTDLAKYLFLFSLPITLSRGKAFP